MVFSGVVLVYIIGQNKNIRRLSFNHFYAFSVSALRIGLYERVKNTYMDLCGVEVTKY